MSTPKMSALAVAKFRAGFSKPQPPSEKKEEEKRDAAQQKEKVAAGSDKKAIPMPNSPAAVTDRTVAALRRAGRSIAPKCSAESAQANSYLRSDHYSLNIPGVYVQKCREQQLRPDPALDPIEAFHLGFYDHC